MADTLLNQFITTLAQAEPDIDLAATALLIARQAYPDLDADSYLERLDRMAEALRERLDPDYTPVDTMLELNQYLFSELGFAGNRQDYYDPRNSFLNDVLDRRLGIPITLSIVYLEVGRRVGLDLEGVPFPGHFLVKLHVNEGEVILDPYGGGASLGLDDLEERMEQAMGNGRPLRPLLPGLLSGTTKRNILVRMLRNLRSVYLRREDHLRVLQTLDWILACQPDDAEALRDRGLAYETLECAKPALADLRRYLDLAPRAPDAESIRARVIDLQRAARRLN